jgi:hypothetical protein
MFGVMSMEGSIENPKRGGRNLGQGSVDGFEEDAKRP